MSINYVAHLIKQFPLKRVQVPKVPLLKVDNNCVRVSCREFSLLKHNSSYVSYLSKTCSIKTIA